MAFTLLKPSGIDLSQTFAFTGSVTGAGGGKLLQVKTKHLDTSVATTSGGLTTILTSDTITLSSSSNSLFIIASVHYDLQGYSNTTDPGAEFRLYDQAGNMVVKHLVELQMTDNADGMETSCVMQHMYSPPDTSETVNIQYRCGAGQIRARGSDVYRNSTCLTVMEIAS